MSTNLKQKFADWVARLLKIPAHNHYNNLVQNGWLKVGHHTYGIPEIDVYQGSEQKVSIGNYCSISKGVRIITGGIHPKDWVSLYPFRTTFNLPGAYQDGMPTSNGPVTIGHDVWIGTDAIIMSGVTIGHGAIIAAGAIVTKDVKPYSLVAGIPARHINYRIAEEHIGPMLEIGWWNWDEKKILEAVPLLSSNHVKQFIEQYYSDKY